MSQQEHIHAFESQIDNSLDARIESLKSEDEQLSQALGSIKGIILGEIGVERKDYHHTNEAEEKFSEDLEIDFDELESIFYNLLDTHPDVLNNAGVKEFGDFLSLIGLENKTKIEYNKQRLNDITLFGEPVLFTPPLGITEQVSQNFSQVFRNIESHKELAPLITPETVFTPLGGARIEFSLEDDGEVRHYTASPEGVFQIESQGDRKDRKTLIQKTKEKGELDLQVQNTISNSGLAVEIQNEIYELYNDNFPLAYTVLSDGSNIQKSIIQVAEYGPQLGYEILELTEKVTKRQLIDVSTGFRVEEFTRFPFSAHFSYTYLHPEDYSTPQTKIGYEGNSLSHKIQYFPDGKTQQSNKSYFQGEVTGEHLYNPDSSLKRYTSYNNGKPRYYKEGNTNHFYAQDRKNISYIQVEESPGVHTTYMISESGTPFSTFAHAQENDPGVTKDQYLDFLSQEINTGEKLHLFFELFMQYTHDNPDKPLAGITEKNIGELGDIWRLAEETISLLGPEGQMRGDCDDYAFLAKEILTRQGKNAYVLGIPSHAICVWFDQNDDGSWNAHSIGTFGYDKNGNRFGMVPDSEKEKGYSSMQEALNSILVKYDTPGKGLERGVNYRVTNEKVEIFRIPEAGMKSELLGGRGDTPITLMDRPDILNQLLDARNKSQLRDYAGAISIYEGLMKADPQNQELYSKEYHHTHGMQYIPDTTGQHYEKVIHHFSIAVKLGHVSWDVFTNLSNAYWTKGEKEKAIDLLESWIIKSLDNPDQIVYIHKHIARFITDNYNDKREKVHEHIDKAIDIYTESLDSGIYPKAIQQKISLNLLKEADYREEVHQEIFQLLQQKLHLIPYQAITEADLTSGVGKVFVLLAEKFPDRVEYSEYAAKYSTRIKSRELEKKYYTLAFEQKSESVEIIKRFALILQGEGDLRRAQKVLVLGIFRIQDENKTVDLTVQLGDVFFEEGDFKNAIKYYTQAFESHKNSISVANINSLKFKLVKAHLHHGSISVFLDGTSKEEIEPIYSRLFSSSIAFNLIDTFFIVAIEKYGTIDDYNIYCAFLHMKGKTDLLKEVAQKAIQEFPKSRSTFEQYLK